jgi:hypothetical protein
LLGLLRKPRRGWAIFTIAATGFVLLSQAVTLWVPAGEPAPGTRPPALLASVMLLATVGVLMAVAHAGVPGSSPGAGPSNDRPPSDGRNRGSTAPS